MIAVVRSFISYMWSGLNWLSSEDFLQQLLCFLSVKWGFLTSVSPNYWEWRRFFSSSIQKTPKTGLNCSPCQHMHNNNGFVYYLLGPLNRFSWRYTVIHRNMYLDCFKWSAYGMKPEKKISHRLVNNHLSFYTHKTVSVDPVPTVRCSWAPSTPSWCLLNMWLISITFCVKAQNSSKYITHIYIILHSSYFFFPEHLFITGQSPKSLKKSRHNFWRFFRCLFLLGSNSHCWNLAYIKLQRVQVKWI